MDVLRQGEFQEQRAIYVKSVVANGAAEMVSYHAHTSSFSRINSQLFDVASSLWPNFLWHE